MFRGPASAPGEHVLESAEPPCLKPSRPIGKIQTIVGSLTVSRAGTALAHLGVGDFVYEADVIETGADSTVCIHFSDGTVFELSACTRMVLSKFACDGASSNSALFGLVKGAIAFMAGRVAKGGGLSIDTPVARIRGSRGGGIAGLTLAALTFALLDEVRADDQPVIDDDELELPHGTFVLETKEKVPRIIVVDDPWKTVVLQKVGSTVEADQVTNSSDRMDELEKASRDTFAIYRLGQQDSFIQHQQHASLGSGETGSDFSRSDFSNVPVVTPANFVITADSNPVSVVPTTTVTLTSSYVPEVPILIPTTISPPPATITLAALAQQTFIDTSQLDQFSSVIGRLWATATNTNATLTYGIAGGTGDNSRGGYNQSLTSTYGALYLNSTTGVYTFVPNDTTINGLTTPTNATFTLTVSAGTLSTQQTITFLLDGVNDAPTLQPVTGPTYTDTPAAPTISAALAAPTPTNTSEPGLFTAVTGTLIGADVDRPTQTLTYGILGGTTGGSTALGEVTYDVSKTGPYGTLYVNSTTGDYTFVPNDAAIKALPATTVIEDFTVTVSDGALSAEQTFTVTINGVNDAPTPVADVVAVNEDATAATSTRAAGVLSNDTDSDTGETATLVVSAVLAGTSGTATALANGSASVAGSYGTLTINSNGTYSYTPNNAAAEALAQGASATDVFTYTAKDVHGAATTTTLTFDITGQNDAPTPVADVVAVNEDATAATSTRAAGVLSNDTDSDTGETATLVVSAVLAGTSGTATALANGSASVAGSYGTLTINSNGTYSYTPNNAAAEALAQGASATDVFTYTAKDVHGAATTTTLTFDITGQNDAPTPVADVVAVNEDATAATSTRAAGVLSNDTDSDTGETATLVVSAVLAGTSGTATALANGSASVAGSYGTLTINSNGTYSYTPNNAAAEALAQGASATDVFTYTAKDVHGAATTTTLTFDITGQNDAPTPVADVVAVNEDATAATSTRAAGVLSNDTDSDTGETATLVVSAVLAGTSGTATALANGSASVAGSYGTLTINSNGTYSYTPNNAAAEALAQGASATDVFTYTAKDVHGAATTTTLTFDITGQNDAPTPVADVVAVNEDATAATSTRAAGVLSNDTDSDTGETATLVVSAVLAGTSGTATALANGSASVAGSYGTLTINSNGTYSYTPNNAAAEALAQGASATDVFTYTAKDVHGAATTTTLTFDITGQNDAPVIASSPTVAMVSEEGLTNGVPDNLPLSLDKTDSATANGTITATDADGDPLHMTLGVPTPLASGGVAITWTLDDTSHALVGKAGVTTIITATITDAGAYTVALSGPIDHPNAQQEDDKIFDVPVFVSDGHTSTATTLSVTVEDDSPKAAPVEVSISSTDSMTNVMLILDLSGSMAGSRLTAAKAAVNELLNQYDDRGNVMVRIVTFSDTATAHGSTWMNVADAKIVIAGLSAGGNTNYDAALLTAMQAFVADGKLSGLGTQNVSYFISDGDPTVSSDWPQINGTQLQNGIQPNEQAVWETFLTTNNIVSFALGIPTVSTPTNLDPVAFDPALGTQAADAPIIVTDLSQLANALVITVPPLTASVLTGAGGTASNSFGGDGGFVQSITVDGVTYTFHPTDNGGAGTITTGGDSFSYNPTKKTLTVDTDTNAVGGEFALVMTTGAFTFQPPTNFSSATINYVLVDNDGDTASSTLHFFVANTLQPAGIAGEPINLALSDPSDQATAINVTVSGLPSGWTLNGGTHLDDGSWTAQTTDVKSLTVTSSPDFTGAAVLKVTETWTNPDGTTELRMITDNLEAYAPGSPIFAWSGDDTLTGSNGSDLFVFSQPIGQDVIYTFDASHDQIDLIGYAGIASFDDVKSHLTADANGDAVIALADGQSITLDGIAADSLSASNFVFDQTPVMDNAGAMTIGDGALLPLSGAINNAGTIALDSIGHATTLELIQHGITLQGGGQLILSDSDANLISSAAPGVTFTNTDNTISGAGQLGDWQMTLVNNGTIVATGAHALIIDTGSNAVINTGTLNSTGSGGLIVNSDVSNAGLLWAHGGDITVNGSVSGAGGALITGDATLEFAAAASINVTFVGADDFGTLVLDNPAAYTGQIFGFTGTSLENSDIIDLKGITFDVGTSWTYHDNIGFNTGGILTVDDTANGVTVAVDSITFGDGEYTTANFILTSDGNGGTLIADPPEDHATTAIDGGQTADVGGHTGSTHITDAEQALPSTLDGNAGKIAAFALDFVSDQFDFEHMDTNNGVANSQPSHWLTHADLPAPSDGSPAKLGNDNLGGLPENLGIHMAGNSDCLGNHASGSFVFNSTFSQNGTGGLETAQIIAQSDQTVVQTVSDVLADAAHASPETIGPAAESVTIAGSEHHKLLTDFLLHG